MYIYIWKKPYPEQFFFTFFKSIQNRKEEKTFRQSSQRKVRVIDRKSKWNDKTMINIVSPSASPLTSLFSFALSILFLSIVITINFNHVQHYFCNTEPILSPLQSLTSPWLRYCHLIRSPIHEANISSPQFLINADSPIFSVRQNRLLSLHLPQ